jgi:hypothetical protein
MIVFDQEKLSAFFQTVSRGFERSTLEIILVAVSLFAFIALLIVIHQVQRRKIRRQQRLMGENRYRQIVEGKSLTPSEEDLVARMARYLKNPEKKYLILVNQPTFNFCAAKLKETEQIPATSISELRSRLGFRIHGPEQIPAASSELPEGQGLLIVATGAGSGKAQGRLHKQEPASLVVELLEAGGVFREGQEVRVYFQNRSGLFSFHSMVQAVRPRRVVLRHGEEIKRIQRRRYYRRRISQPVAVRIPGSGEQPVLSTFQDLGGNGASLRNPAKRFRPGEALELTFLAAGERFTLVAEVLRVSKGGEVLHVRFAPMPETTRDRIIGSLFKGASKTGS